LYDGSPEAIPGSVGDTLLHPKETVVAVSDMMMYKWLWMQAKRIIRDRRAALHRRKIKRLERKIMAKFDTLNANITELGTDVDALIAAKGQEDPAIQTAIDAAATAVQAVDTKVKAALPTTP
jgi:outer membrane murein-binding lipoprotein Lpp